MTDIAAIPPRATSGTLGRLARRTEAGTLLGTVVVYIFFAALGGALLLGDRLPVVGYFGAALMFFAIVMVEAVPALAARRQVHELKVTN